ncbi:MAG: hypothetical protein II800_05230, partial [Lachnospiraceae bacterium]|nr:hypothetical protein [Lachnospiraceae bacterium]
LFLFPAAAQYEDQDHGNKDSDFCLSVHDALLYQQISFKTSEDVISCLPFLPGTIGRPMRRAVNHDMPVVVLRRLC